MRHELSFKDFSILEQLRKIGLITRLMPKIALKSLIFGDLAYTSGVITIQSRCDSLSDFISIHLVAAFDAVKLASFFVN